MALIVDMVAMWTVLFALQAMGVAFWIAGRTADVAPEPWGESFLAVVTVAALYAVLCIVFVAVTGQTPGMDLLGVAVQRDRQTPSLARSFARALPGCVLALPPVYACVGLGLFALPALFDLDRRTIADRAGGTTVVRVNTFAAPPGDARLIRFGWEKRFAGLAGTSSVLPKSQPLADDPTTLAS